MLSSLGFFAVYRL